MAVTKKEAVEIVRAEATRRGHAWSGPVRASRIRRFLVFGRRYWNVRSNATGRGCNVRAYVDQETGRLARYGYASR